MKDGERDGYTISTDPARLDLARIHRNLSTSYWATNIPIELVRKSIENSIPFGVYAPGGEQVGFARVVTDRATFAYLGDVYVEAAHQKRGLSKRLMERVIAHPDLQGLRRFCLGTRDAHGLYRQFGFEVIRQPEGWMEIKRPNPYP